MCKLYCRQRLETLNILKEIYSSSVKKFYISNQPITVKWKEYNKIISLLPGD